MKNSRRAPLLLLPLLLSAGCGEAPSNDLALTSAPLGGAAPTRLTDFAPPNLDSASSGPSAFTRFGAHIYFVASEPGTGWELWRTSGVPAPAELFLDLAPGPRGSTPEKFTVVGSKMFFSAASVEGDSELFVTDGTRSGTRQLTWRSPRGAVLQSTWALTAHAGKLYFSGTGLSGDEVWQSDGTPEGTHPVTRLGANGGKPDPIVSVGSHLVFVQQVPFPLYPGIYLLDASAAEGATKINDVTDARITTLFAWRDRAAYVGYSSSSDQRLRWLDPAFPGTTTTLPLSNPLVLSVVGGNLLLESAAYVYLSDGVTTEQVDGMRYPRGLGRIGDQLVFHANHPSVGTEAFITNGALDGGTTLIADLRSGDFSMSFRNGSSSTGSVVVFGAAYGPNATVEDLWRTDGTAAGTYVLRPGFYSSASGLGDGNHLYVGYPGSGSVGTEPHVIDVNDGGIMLLADVNPGLQPGVSVPPVVMGDDVYFVGYAAGAGYELMRYVPEDGGMAVLTNSWTERGPYQLEVLDAGVLLFSAFGSISGTRSYAYFVGDGGTTQLLTGTSAAPTPGTDSVNLQGRPYVPFDGALYFSCRDDAAGLELCAATPSGLQFINFGGFYETSPDYLAALEGRLFFSGSFSGNGRELAAYTPGAGLVPELFSLAPGTASASPRELTVSGSTLFFAVTQPDAGTELATWTADAGVVVLDLVAGSGGLNPRALTAFGDGVLFNGTDPQFGDEPHFSDGTLAGTRMLADLAPGPAGSQPAAFTTSGDVAYFSATRPSIGRELFVTDGSGPNTRLFRDLSPGAGSGAPTSMFPLGNRALLFSAMSPGAGLELWETEGTAPKTRLVADLRPGPESSAPAAFVRVGDTVFFRAHDGIRQQLLQYRLTGPGVDSSGYDAGTPPPEPRLVYERGADGGPTFDAGVVEPDAGVTDLDGGTADGGHLPDAGDGGAESDGGTSKADAGVSAQDAGVTDPPAGGTPPFEAEPTGCGCSTGTAGLGLWPLVLGAAMGLRARRRRAAK